MRGGLRQKQAPMKIYRKILEPARLIFKIIVKIIVKIALEINRKTSFFLMAFADYAIILSTFY